MAQALRFATMRLLKQPDYSGAYDPETDPLWTYTPVVPKVDVLSWYHCDHLGTPQEMSDRNGQIVWSADHKAWGEIREQRSEKAQQQGLSNPLRFQGQGQGQYHETGLHYNRYRYYDPRVGRFIRKDPIGYAGGLNLFAYAPNPVGWVDPLGLARKMGDTNCICSTCPLLPLQIDPRNLRSRQTRAEMSRNRVDNLTSRMKKNGYDESYPIDVADADGNLIIIDGHHRAQAATRAHVEKVPVIIHSTDPTTAKKLESHMYDSRCQ